MTPGGRFWTSAEIKRALVLRDEGYTHAEMGVALNRSTGSLSTMFRDLKRRESRSFQTLHAATSAEPSPTEDEAEASERLRVAILTSIARFANDSRTDIDRAAAFLLSGREMADAA